ncbi:hypothetical protein [Lysobacter sp. A03]|uniref:restriction endonuclease n=1 Tax=Lysobacter sp. A03 TaxID=1199154 RepID=UPI000695C454|nr:hypothetical protein [Lysobacter sp. A03]
MTALNDLLDSFRYAAVSEREKGTYFEELIVAYLRNEATYRDLYDQVWTWADWAKSQGLSAKDDGIDLVARVAGTGELHAIQCKFYDPDYKLQRRDTADLAQSPMTPRAARGSGCLDFIVQDAELPVEKRSELAHSAVDSALIHRGELPCV